jgi:hypothetical protein
VCVPQEGAVHESPQQAQRAFVRAETALLRHDRPLAFPGEGVAADAQAGQSRAEQTAASLKRLSVRHQALAHKPPASTSALPANGIAGYSSGGSHMGHAPGFLGQYYFVGSSTGPAGFADYDNRKPTATSYPIEINFQNKGDFKEVDPSLENGQIAARWVGKIEVKAGGKYKFMSKSNNGSWVFVDGQKVIENDGGEDTKESDEMNLSPVLRPCTAISFSDTLFLSFDEPPSSFPRSDILAVAHAAGAQGYHAFTADFFANTDDENMIVKYKGPDTDGSWKLLEGVHRTDFDYLDALSLNNLPDPRSTCLFLCVRCLPALYCMRSFTDANDALQA